jgi:flavin-dependent dehydrogenase
MPEHASEATIHTEVCIVGGGPSGSALALRLRQLGYSVAVVEKQAFPRAHVGESLVGGVLPLLDVLCIRREIESAGFLRPKGAIVRWAGVAERRETPGEPGFQVDRGLFDKLLLHAAKKAGALVLQPAHATKIERCGAHAWRVTVRCETGIKRIEARFVADATGRAGLARARHHQSAVKTLALYAYWRGARFDGAETRIDVFDDGWYWGAPLPSGEFNGAVFIDASVCRKGLAQAGSLNAFYDSLLARSELLAPVMQGARLGPVRACDATPFYRDVPATADSIKVGEAAFSIDPLSSQGVQVAIGSALHAAAVIHTILKRPVATSLALEFYRMRLLESVSLHARAASVFYQDVARTRPGEFWQKRAVVAANNTENPPARPARPAPTLLTKVQLAPDVNFRTAPAIRGDYIEPSTAITFPDARRPITFLDGIEVAPLVAMIQRPATVEHIVRTWTQHIPLDRAQTIIRWLWETGVICSAPMAQG